MNDRDRFRNSDPSQDPAGAGVGGSSNLDLSNIVPKGQGTGGKIVVYWTGAPMDPTADDPSARPDCDDCNQSAGQPIEVTTGNVYFDQVDAIVPGFGPGLRFARSYNSINASTGGIFGPGWTYSYEKALRFPSSTKLKLSEGSGVPRFYQDQTGSGTFVGTNPTTQEDWFVLTSGSYIRHFRRGGQEAYDANGRLNKITSVTGAVLLLGYDTSNRLISIGNAPDSNSPITRSLTLTYAGNQAQSLIGPDGSTAIATYSYNGAFLQQVTYGDGSGSSYTYDQTTGGLATVADLTGTVLETHTYDRATGKGLTSEISNGQKRYTFSYSANQTTVTDAIGNVTTYQWGSFGGVNHTTSITGAYSFGGGSQSWSYDTQGNVTTYTDANGKITQSTYDPVTNDLLTVTDPLLNVTRYTYWPDGRVHTITAADNGVITYLYDQTGGPSSITDPLNRPPTVFSYYSNGKLHTIQDSRGKTTTMTYYPTGDLQSVMDPLQHTTTFGYDAMGRRTTVTDAMTPSNTTTTTYWPQGQVKQIKYPDQTHTDYTYDLGGRLKTVSDPLQHVTTIGYDAYGRRQTVTDPNSPAGVTTYAYDNMSNLTTITDARGKGTTFGYSDGFNRLNSITYPGQAAIETLTYDAVGRLKTRTDRKGVTTTYTYYPTGWLQQKSYSDATPSVSYTYDPVGRMATATNSTDSLTWSYDLAGQRLSEASSLNSSTVGYLFDNDGNRTTLELNGTPYLTYGYDDASRLTTITVGSNNFTFGYDNDNRRTSLLYPNQLTTLYSYDTLSRLTLVHTTNSVSDLTSAGYAYDNAGNRTSKSIPSYSETYGYDALNRLTQVNRGTPMTEQYTYDAVGNRATSLNTTGNWVYDDRNELKSNSNDAFTYDPNGNLIQKVEGSDTWTYQWDAENQLQSVSKNASAVASYAYDPIGRRVRYVTGTNTIAYGYDGQNILTKAGSWFVQGPGIDEPLAIEGTPQGAFYYHSDGLGSVVLTTDPNAVAAGSYQYDAFGNIQVGATIGGYAFTGREWESETGLFYYRARYYDPKVGRFISEDPIQAGSYGYAGNNPVVFGDPSGLYLELTGAGWQKSLGFLQQLVGPEAAGLLRTRAIGDDRHQVYCGGDLSAGGPLGGLLSAIIRSNKLLEITLADPSTMISTLSGSMSVASLGGAGTVGAEESLVGITQIFISEDAGAITSALMTSVLYRSASSDSNPLTYTTAGVLAHELGHAFLNMLGAPTNSAENNAGALYWDRMWQASAGNSNYRVRH